MTSDQESKDSGSRPASSRPNLALAALACAVVETLAESDPRFAKIFLGKLEAAYRLVEESPDVEDHELDTLIATKQLLEGEVPRAFSRAVRRA